MNIYGTIETNSHKLIMEYIEGESLKLLKN